MPFNSSTQKRRRKAEEERWKAAKVAEWFEGDRSTGVSAGSCSASSEVRSRPQLLWWLQPQGQVQQRLEYELWGRQRQAAVTAGGREGVTVVEGSAGEYGDERGRTGWRDTMGAVLEMKPPPGAPIPSLLLARFPMPATPGYDALKIQLRGRHKE